MGPGGIPLLARPRLALGRTARADETAAAELRAAIHVRASIIATALKRQTYGVTQVSKAMVARQQKEADAFSQLGLLPKPVIVSDAVIKAE